jgi:hypothetical protein
MDYGLDLDTYNLYYELRDIIWEIKHQVRLQNNILFEKLYRLRWLIETARERTEDLLILFKKIEEAIDKLEEKTTARIAEIIAAEIGLSRQKAINLSESKLDHRVGCSAMDH